MAFIRPNLETNLQPWMNLTPAAPAQGANPIAQGLNGLASGVGGALMNHAMPQEGTMPQHEMAHAGAEMAPHEAAMPLGDEHGMMRRKSILGSPEVMKALAGGGY